VVDEDDDAAADMEDDNTPWLCESPDMPAASRSNVQPQPPPPQQEPPQQSQQQQQQRQAQRQRRRAQPEASLRSHTDGGLQPSARAAHSSDALPALRSPRSKEKSSQPNAARGGTTGIPCTIHTTIDIAIGGALSAKPSPVSASVPPQPVSPPFSPPKTRPAAAMPRAASGTATTTPLPTTSAAAVAATAASIVDSPKKRQREASVAGATSPAGSPAKRSLATAKHSLEGTAAGVRAMLSKLLRAPSAQQMAQATQCIDALAQWAARPAEARGGWCGSEEVTQVCALVCVYVCVCVFMWLCFM